MGFTPRKVSFRIAAYGSYPILLSSAPTEERSWPECDILRPWRPKAISAQLRYRHWLPYRGTRYLYGNARWSNCPPKHSSRDADHGCTLRVIYLEAEDCKGTTGFLSTKLWGRAAWTVLQDGEVWPACGGISELLKHMGCGSTFS